MRLEVTAEPDDEETEIAVVVVPNGYVIAQASAERLGAEAIRIIATATRAAQRSANRYSATTRAALFWCNLSRVRSSPITGVSALVMSIACHRLVVSRRQRQPRCSPCFFVCVGQSVLARDAPRHRAAPRVDDPCLCHRFGRRHNPADHRAVLCHQPIFRSDTGSVLGVPSGSAFYCT